MTLTALFRKPGRLAGALLAVVGLLLLGAGAAAADEGDFEKPGAFAFGTAPGCMSVNWIHSGSGVAYFTVERQSPSRGWDDVNAAQRTLPDCGLEPSTAYSYKICAYFYTSDGDSECSEWSKPERTLPPEQPRPAQRPPTPRIVEHHAGETWIGIKWEAGFDYDSYFVNTTERVAPGQPRKGPRTIHHDDDGTWGYQRIDGLLPGRTYAFGVQGCTETFFGIGDDHCWDWSAEYVASTLAYPLHSGPDTCAPPYVWREAFAGDHVCVTVARRSQVAADNAQANARRAYYSDPKNGPFTVPDTCKSPYVWREAQPSDHVCVTVEERSRVAAENATANERRAVPQAPGRPATGSGGSGPVVK